MFQFPGLAFVPYVFRNKYLLSDLCYSKEMFFHCPTASGWRPRISSASHSLLANRLRDLLSQRPTNLRGKTSNRPPDCASSRQFFGIIEIEGGFPHSEILGSKLVRSSPRLIAAYHVLHRLSAPRHPPNALMTLDCSHYRRPPFLSPLGRGEMSCRCRLDNRSKRPFLASNAPGSAAVKPRSL